MNLQIISRFIELDQSIWRFRWIADYSKCHKGDIAGTLRPDGYRQIRLGGTTYLEHRLVWLFITGEWPINQIDHRDTDRGNNDWTNLRDATHAQNKMNTPIQKNNMTGYKGVHFNTREKKYVAAIKSNGEQICLGRFDDPSEAGQAYIDAAKRLHGEFANVGEAS